MNDGAGIWMMVHARAARRPHTRAHCPRMRVAVQQMIASMEVIVKLTELFLAELAAEAPRTRRALERVPEGKDD